MKQTEFIMGMPITLWLPSEKRVEPFKQVFDFFRRVDETFSPYKKSSEISQINRGELAIAQASGKVREVLTLCGEMKKETHGYFDITRSDGTIDPSGLVKGWAIKEAGKILNKLSVPDYSIDAGGDILLRGKNNRGELWSVGIRLPGDPKLLAKQLHVTNCAVATSGTYERGNHIYNPHTGKPATDLASVTIVGPDICIADVLATAVFAMSKSYQKYLATTLPPHYEAYIIHPDQTASFTPEFEKFTN